jgi:hypothetical protein
MDSDHFGGICDAEGLKIRSLSDVGYDIRRGFLDNGDPGKLLYPTKKQEVK